MKIIEGRVKPERDKQKRDANRERWWQYAEVRPGLCAAIKGLDRVLVVPRVGQQCGFTFLPTGMIQSEQLVVSVLPACAAFCVLQSRPHEVWARFFASSMKDDLRYTPSDCFETFPFPSNFESSTKLEAAGQAYYEFRAALMVRNNEGLTKTYNRFHDPDERSADILKLRDLHDAMDRAVLYAYGPPFSDLTVPECQFLLDYEDDEDEDEPAGKRRKKKPWRYRWPDAFRDEVLALLLDLNKQRADAEKAAAADNPPAKKAGRKKKASADDSQPDLFGTAAG